MSKSRTGRPERPRTQLTWFPGDEMHWAPLHPGALASEQRPSTAAPTWRLGNFGMPVRDSLTVAALGGLGGCGLFGSPGGFLNWP